MTPEELKDKEEKLHELGIIQLVGYTERIVTLRGIKKQIECFDGMDNIRKEINKLEEYLIKEQQRNVKMIIKNTYKNLNQCAKVIDEDIEKEIIKFLKQQEEQEKQIIIIKAQQEEKERAKEERRKKREEKKLHSARGVNNLK